MHINSVLIFKSHALRYFFNEANVLEIGPFGYPSFYAKAISKKFEVKWHSLDISESYIEGGEANPFHIVSKHEYEYPIEDETFDIVLAGQVIEHVKKPWVWLQELKRITKKDGKVIIVNPISWPYHEAPVDCWRIYPEGMNALAEELNMTLLESTYESLEIELLPSKVATIPGHSILDANGKVRPNYKIPVFLSNALGYFPKINKLVRIPVAYDCISILQKV